MDTSGSANHNHSSPMSLNISQCTVNSNSINNNNNNNSLTSNNNNINNINNNNNNVTNSLNVNSHENHNQQGPAWIDELFLSARLKAHHGATPLRQRKLPASFFTPPDPSAPKSASHSRESSIDQSFSPYPYQTPASPLSPSNGLKTTAAPQQQQQQRAQHTVANNGAITSPDAIINANNRILTERPTFTIVHNRAHSLPANLQQQTLSLAPINTESTTNGVNNSALLATGGSYHIRQYSYDIDKIKLPDGWEIAIEKTSNRRYFIDHKNKTTTWDDPRLAILQNLQQQQQAKSLLSKQQQQQPPQQTSVPGPIQGPSNVHTPLPESWDHQSTAGKTGEQVSFVDQNNASISWSDGRSSLQLGQAKSSVPNTLSGNNVGGNVITTGNNLPHFEHLRTHSTSAIGSTGLSSTLLSGGNHSLINTGSVGCLNSAINNATLLMNERDRIRQRSQELTNQFRLNPGLQLHGLSDELMTNVLNGNVTNDMDPFLFNSSNNHIRGKSSDSGLSLSSFSIPRSPEDLFGSDTETETLRSTMNSSMINGALNSTASNAQNVVLEEIESLDITSMDLGTGSEDLMSTFTSNDIDIDLDAFLGNSG